ncbi:MAG: PPOX class F420-dependent oxidoreductase [Pseudomonadales bacterium]|nr:PPOX class F420-dependent oxidoreductase [Pseudomonadales bacterium]
MSIPIPKSHLDLLEGPIYVQLATHMKDGSIQVNPVWCSYDGEHILINSALGRIKDKNMQANPKVTVFAGDPSNPYRWLEVRGVVVEITQDGADAHIDDLAELYLGQRPYPFREDGEVRMIYKIQPQRVQPFAM